MKGSPIQQAKCPPVLRALSAINDSHIEINSRRKPPWLRVSGVLKFQINSEAWQGCILLLANLAFCEIVLVVDFMHLYVCL